MLVPKLRFKEFKDEWKKISLINVFSFYNTNSLSRADLSEEGSIKNIHYGDIHQKFNNILDVNKEKLPYIKSDIKINIHNGENYCKDGDLVLADASEDYDGIGKAVELINVGDNKIVSGLHTILARDTNKIMSLGFKGYLFNTSLIHNQIRVLANGFKVYGISKNNIYDLDVRIPTKTEQKKITNFLMLLDKKIELQQRKIEALKIYKKGLSQKLFKSIKFDKDSKKIKISNFLKERKIYSEKGLEYPHVTLSKYGIYDKTSRYNRDFLVMSEDKKYKITYLNDLCYNPANLKFGVICLNEYGNAIFSPIYITLEINTEIINERFCKHYFTRVDFINKVRKYEQGTVYERMSVNVEDFLKHADIFPSMKKQKKIAQNLDFIDVKLELENKKLNMLNDYKRGLLQQMFI